jgi:hypothetical protein
MSSANRGHLKVYAAHFAAGLAIKSRIPEAPTWALLVGAFIPDFIWVVLANRGVEPTEPRLFFDDWSHSLLMIGVWASLFALMFWRRERRVVLAVWFAVFSHFLLDFPVHPKFLALYPHSSFHIGLALSGTIGPLNYWWAQMCVLAVLTAIYVHGTRSLRFQANLVAASCVALFGLHLLMFPG